MAWVICDNCKTEFYKSDCYMKRPRKHHFCCKKCEAKYRAYNNTLDNWQGGHISKSTGYKYIEFNGKQVEEHRLVMMKHLGRDLDKDEVVHHKNGNRLDNRIENLELLSRSEHASMHGLKRGHIVTCPECGKDKKAKARGLCATCYGRLLRIGGLDKYEKKAKIS